MTSRPGSLARTVSSLLAAVALTASAAGANLWPGTNYRDDIPSFEQVLGHQPGEWIVSPNELLEYFDALAEAAPDQIKIWEYGRTWQGRKMFSAEPTASSSHTCSI